MRLRGVRGLATAGRWLRSRFVTGGLILLYHRVAGHGDPAAGDPAAGDPAAGDPAADPFSLAVTEGVFAEHMEALRRTATLLSLRDLSSALATGRLPRRAVAVTFDDGYADNLEHARPLLEKYDVPATFFIVSGTLGGTFWWEELCRCVWQPQSLPETLALTVGGRTFAWRPRPEGPQRHARLGLLCALHRLLRPLSEAERQPILKRLAAWSGTAPGSSNGPRPLSAAELAQLAAGDLVEIGAHSVTHPPLAALSEAAQRREIAASRRQLERIVGRAVTSFSYPFGGGSDFTDRTVALVREAGFERACTNVVDVAHHGSDVYRLPRYWVRNWNGPQLERHLRQWLRA